MCLIVSINAVHVCSYMMCLPYFTGCASIYNKRVYHVSVYVPLVQDGLVPTDVLYDYY